MRGERVIEAHGAGGGLCCRVRTLRSKGAYPPVCQRVRILRSAIHRLPNVAYTFVPRPAPAPPPTHTYTRCQDWDRLPYVYNFVKSKTGNPEAFYWLLDHQASLLGPLF